MNSGADSLLRVKPRTPVPLDPGFRPPVLGLRRYREAVARAPRRERARIAVEAARDQVCRVDLDVLPPGSPHDADTLRLVERLAKFALWAWGGRRIVFSGPPRVGEHLRRRYAAGGERTFDVELMERVYQKPFAVDLVSPQDVPATAARASAIGGHLDGCRIGFDLGASDYKVAAVRDGEAVFTTELPWNPRNEPDPAYHYRRLNDGLKLAASHLPRVDAIGGSSAGIIVDNQVMAASLFRAVPPERFKAEAQTIFLRLQKEWGVPLEVANDGDVTALAGAMSLGVKGILGVAMGSSEAAGYLTPEGAITGWLNELAFAPVDFNPAAEADEWSGDRGVGAMYFSQQAVNRLLPAARLSYPADMGLPERLKAVQELADKGNSAALRIFETIGVYLGYTIPWYAEHYDLRHMLILGRVTSGAGGDVILDTARRLVEQEFPEVAARVRVHVPDEKSRRVGQAVAAASLPAVRSGV